MKIDYNNFKNTIKRQQIQMIINPSHNCTWSYNNGKLVINLTTDDGESYQLDTNYRVDDLDVRPENNEPFCVFDANLLTEYQDGISKRISDEGTVLSIGLRAVACMRFARVGCPYSKFFTPVSSRQIVPSKGMFVNIYSKNGNYGHCIVLDEKDADGLVRLMLLSEELEVMENRGFSNGMMIRVAPEYVCRYEEHMLKYA